LILIYDEDDIRGEFGSIETMEFFAQVAENNKLRSLKNFFDLGFTIDIRRAVEEVETIDWPTVDGYNEVASNLVATLMKCKSMAIID